MKLHSLKNKFEETCMKGFGEMGFDGTFRNLKCF